MGRRRTIALQLSSRGRLGCLPCAGTAPAPLRQRDGTVSFTMGATRGKTMLWVRVPAKLGIFTPRFSDAIALQCYGVSSPVSILEAVSERRVRQRRVSEDRYLDRERGDAEL